MGDAEFDAVLKELAEAKPKTLPRLLEQAMREAPARIGEAIRAAGGLKGADVTTRLVGPVRDALRELHSRVEAEGLDPVIRVLEDHLVAIWSLEEAGAFRATDGDEPPVNAYAELFPPVFRKLAPPPPKKVKLDQPIRRIPPLSKANVRAAVDVATMLQGLLDIGDWTQLPDKERVNRELLMDDWRRMIFDSAALRSWDEFRAAAPASAPDSPAEKLLTTKFSRSGMIATLQAMSERRKDNITTLPNVSVLACRQCGGFQGRERMRCEKCSGVFCVRCRARSADLCLADYVVEKYGAVAPDLRARIIAEAQSMCTKARLDEHTRNELFVKFLAERGIDVVFADTAPEDGEEGEAPHGRRKLLVRSRENATVRRIFFASLARAHFAGNSIEPTPVIEALFVDSCLGVPVETGLQWAASRAPKA